MARGVVKISKPNQMETVVCFKGKVESSLVAAAVKAQQELSDYTREVAKSNGISNSAARAAIKMAQQQADDIERSKKKETDAAEKTAKEQADAADKLAQKEAAILAKRQNRFNEFYKKMDDRCKAAFKSMGKSTLNGIGSAAKSVTKGIAVGTLAVVTAAAVAIGGFAMQGLELASSLSEVQNVVSVTFGASEAAINDFADSALNKFGVTELNAKKFSGTLGAMFKSMNVGEKDMVAMSANLTALSGDMASFYNITSEDAFEKLRSGISGEAEPLKELGINMSVANLEEFAKAQGETTKFADMDQAQQAMMRYAFIMKASADAQGDFMRTSDEYANQQRLLSENYKQLSGKVMQGLLPAFAGVFKELNTFMAEMDIKPLVDFVSTIAETVVGFMPLIQQILPQLSSVFLSLLPMFMGLITSLVPLVTDILPMIVNLVSMVMPLIAQIISVLMPIVSILLTAFMEALGPLIPIISELLTLLTPILIALAEVVGFLIELAGALVGEWLKKVIEVFKTIAGFFGGKGKEKSEQATGMAEYANGGFASIPSIFGEAGLEAAIPIKPGNARSIGLLTRTAELLGVHNNINVEPILSTEPPALVVAAVMGGRTNSYQFNYSPVINGGNKAEVEPLLKQNAKEAKRIFDDFKEDMERRSI